MANTEKGQEGDAKHDRNAGRMRFRSVVEA